MHNVAFRNQENMADWIFPGGTLGMCWKVCHFASCVNVSLIAVSVESMDEAPEIVAIGVEELVDLNASNLMKARWGAVR